MHKPVPAKFPTHLWALIAIYTAASLAHFAHNAEYIAFYPNMPTWITRETVYQAWLAVASVGMTGSALALVGWPVAGALLVAIYGAFGLDGLAHYTLALCSQHTLAANLTIWSEATAGVMLLVAAGRLVFKQRGRRRRVLSGAQQGAAK